jgi:predicted ATPase
MNDKRDKVRLTVFKAKDFRSLRDVSLGDPPPELPPVVLLYGENDTGKSNIIQAVGVWLRITQALVKAMPQEANKSDVSVDLYEDYDWSSEERPEELQEILGKRPDDLFRYGTDLFELEGELTLELSDGTERAYRFRFGVSREHGGMFQCQVIKAIWSGVRKNAPLPAGDPEARDLRAALRSPWQQIGAERRFAEEQLPVGASDEWGTAIDPTGHGLKLRLFRAAHGVQAARRGLFRQHFVALLTKPPFPPPFALPEPTPAVGIDGKIELLFDDHPIEHRGSGPQQWVLMAGLLAMSEAGIAGLEEPEAHLSWEGQRRVAQALRTLTLDGSRPPHQLFVSTHSSLMEDIYPNETVYYNVTMTAGETQVERSEDRERLQARFSTPKASLLIPRRLHSANLVRLSDEAVKHLAAEPGELLFEVQDDDGSLRLVTEKQMARYLGGPPVEGDGA